jgi:hypothetical protein
VGGEARRNANAGAIHAENHGVSYLDQLDDATAAQAHGHQAFHVVVLSFHVVHNPALVDCKLIQTDWTQVAHIACSRGRFPGWIAPPSILYHISC